VLVVGVRPPRPECAISWHLSGNRQSHPRKAYATAQRIPKLFVSFIDGSIHICCSIIDVSSVDEVAQRWNLYAFKGKDKALKGGPERSYRAEDNLLRAIQRLKTYKETLFNVKEHHHKKGHHGSSHY
jgi:hypothetical protein